MCADMFSSIIGHDQLKERLSAHLKKDPAGTYLFYGPASIGKRTTAFEASKAVLCHNRIADDCDCPSCKKFKSGHPDFFTVGQDGKIKVADVDRFLEFAETTPLLSDFKAAVLDNAHEITWEAANRLLRVLEEPPAGFVIFLVSSDPQSLLLTDIRAQGGIGFERKHVGRAGFDYFALPARPIRLSC